MEKKHVVLFVDGTEKWVEQKVADYIMAQSANGLIQGVKIEGGFYRFNTISKILAEDDYYTQYPDKRPERSVYNEFYGGTRDYIPIERTAEEQRINMRGILKGLKQFIDEQMAKGNKPLEAMRMYKQKLDRYKQQYAPDTAQTPTPTG